MKLIQSISLAGFLTIGTIFCSYSQDSLKTKGMFIPRKNVVRYNLTPNILGFSSAIFGYERVVTPYSSFSVNAGYLAIGKSGTKNNEEYEFTGTKTRNGFSIAADYRFYLKSESKDQAPHGLYIGPYFVHYNFYLKNGIQKINENSTTSNAEVEADIHINNFGFELGYQFNFWNRVTLDLVLVGPSFGTYNLKMSLDSDIDTSEIEENEKLEAVRDILFAKYPWMETLLEEKQIDLKGRKSHWGFGFRYVMQIGIRF